MDVKDLIIFMKVVEHGNISQAAKALNYVQSNVTARIQKLERQLHTPLFHRHSRGMTLTPEGKKLVAYAEKLIALSIDMQQAFRSAETPGGKLDLATVETVIQLPYILSTYNKRYEHIDLTLTTGVTEHLIDEVLNFRLDGAFVTARGTTVHPDLVQYDVFEEQLVLISSEPKMSLQHMMERPFLVFSTGCGYRAKLEEWLRDQQVATTKMMELGTLETILGSVYAGIGVSYVPYSTVKHHVERGLIHCYHLPEQYSKIKTVFIHNKEAFMTSTLQTFIDTIAACRDEEVYSFPFL